MTSETGRSPSQRTRETIRTCDGDRLLQALRASAVALEQQVQAINALNVFPVPDGDTGTNMMRTLWSALKEVENSPTTSAGEITQKVAQGALMGARGNSGVILSQILRGIARSLQKKDAFSANDLASAMVEGAATAYKGVLKPVEGTILTVAREVADAALAASEQSDNLVLVLEAALDEAHRSISRTPSLLPVLKEAGVVDAGGQGLVVMLEGIVRFARGEMVEVSESVASRVDLSGPGLHTESGYGYDTQFIIHGEDLDVDTIRRRISELGDSVMVVGDSNTVKVHVHTPSPGDPINYGTSVGSLSHIIVENMQEQYQEFIQSQAQSRSRVSAEEICNIATVAVAPGEGLQKVFESLGASAVVPGGQTMNPSTEELLSAINRVKADNVIVLPNNKNVILPAEQAKTLSTKNVFVLPTKTVPQGIGALLAFNYQADAATNARAMGEAFEHVQTIEVTRAVRSARVNGLSVNEGQVIGLLNGDLKTSGDDFHSVVLELLSTLTLDDHEIVTIYYGEGVAKRDAEELAKRITEQFDHLEVEIVDGGQPHYPYILSVE